MRLRDAAQGDIHVIYISLNSVFVVAAPIECKNMLNNSCIENPQRCDIRMTASYKSRGRKCPHENPVCPSDSYCMPTKKMEGWQVVSEKQTKTNPEDRRFKTIFGAVSL